MSATDPAAVDAELLVGGISDDELAALALSSAVDQADPDAPPDLLLLGAGSRGPGLLPTCYLPPAMAGRRGRWAAVLAVLLILAFLTITALGFCITYGSLVFA